MDRNEQCAAFHHMREGTERDWAIIRRRSIRIRRRYHWSSSSPWCSECLPSRFRQKSLNASHRTPTRGDVRGSVREGWERPSWHRPTSQLVSRISVASSCADADFDHFRLWATLSLSVSVRCCDRNRFPLTLEITISNPSKCLDAPSTNSGVASFNAQGLLRPDSCASVSDSRCEMIHCGSSTNEICPRTSTAM